VNDERDTQQAEDDALIRKLRPVLHTVIQRDTLSMEFWEAVDEMRELLKPETLSALLRVIDRQTVEVQP
jgi:hypothetical protein